MPGELAPGVGPLSTEHFLALANARRRAKKVRRAANVATVSGWTMALFAIITLLGALFGDWVSLILGIGLLVVTYNELRGAAMLRRFEPRGARLLGLNQIGLGVLIVIYAMWSMVAMLATPALGMAGGLSGSPEVDAMMGRITTLVAYGLYGGIAVAGVVGPGLTSWYYFTRARIVREVVAATPEWVIQTMRAAA